MTPPSGLGRSAQGGGFNLYTTRASGGMPVRLTDGLWIEGNPSWSSDGSTIAFDSNREGGRVGVHVVGSAGGESRRVAAGLSPSWSSTGDAIAFMRLDHGAYDVLTMRYGGDDVRNVAAHPSDHVEPRASSALFLVELRGGRVVRMTSDPLYDLTPTWGA